MYEIKGVFTEKLLSDGHVLRMKGIFTQHLNTEKGVVKFLQEQRPFSELKITDLFGGDKTDYFLKEVEKADGQSKG